MQRRRLLRIAGAASALALPDATAGADGRYQESRTCSLPRCIHPRIGHTGFSFDDLVGLPPDLLPDHQVKLVTRPRGTGAVDGSTDGDGGGDDDGSGGGDGNGSGGPGTVGQQPPESFFEPTGIAIESGDVVVFTPDAPDHGIAAYHPQFGRQRRVPAGVAPFSSPTIGAGDFWLYRFEEPGVYDLRDPQHEMYGAAMRVVVDGGAPAFGPATVPGRRPPQLTAGLVLSDDALAPGAIDERGAVGWDDLAPGSKQLLVEFRDPLQALVERFEGEDTDATEPFELGDGILVVVYEHEGAGRFVVELVDTAGDEPADRIADEFDAASGITALGIRGGEYVLDVQAGGPWTVELAQPTATEANVVGLPATVDGDGPGYAGPFLFEGLVRATATHHGTGTFFVEGYDDAGGRAGGVIFDESGRFQGQTTFTLDGIGWITVDADGAWTITLEHEG